jgi:DNA repair protein RadC
MPQRDASSENPSPRSTEGEPAIERAPVLLKVRARAPGDLPKALRPREKVAAHGARVLSHGELLSLVIGTGTRTEPAARIADDLLRRHGLRRLAQLPAAEWGRQRGIGGASAARMCAVFELGRRLYGKERGDEPVQVTKPREVYERVREIGRARKEHLVGIYLDAQNGIVHQETLSIGSLNTTRTHPREILFPAIAHLALGFILAHNHPSGGLAPSPEDLEFTRAVQRAGELMGIELYDHLIVTRSGFASMRELGMM